MSQENKWKVHVSQEELLCAAGCGFYGNPQWKGYCSKCYRDYQAKQKRQEDYAKNRTLLSFDKFEEKKKQKDERKSNTLFNVLKRSPTRGNGSGTVPKTRQSASLKATTNQQISAGLWKLNIISVSLAKPLRLNQKFSRLVPLSSLPAPLNGPLPAHVSSPTGVTHVPSARHHHKRRLSAESQTARDCFLKFLQELPKPVAHEIVSKTQHAVDKIQQHQELQSDEISEMVQDLYQLVADRLAKNSLMTNASHSAEEVMQEMERYVCIRAYHSLFCHHTDEEVADLSLQDRIRSLHWVTAGFLETSLDFTQQVVRDKMDDATIEIIDMNNHRAPRDKLESLVRCSRSIFEALKDSRQGTPASADEYLPALIYVILKANPPLLQSNINFVSRFSLPINLMSGEAGYFFTNLCCAKNYVQNMNSDSLNMPKEEFEAYTSGQLVPPLTEANCQCHQAIKSMENSLVELEKLSERANKLEMGIKDRRKKMEEKTGELLEKAKEVNEKYPPPKPLDVWLLEREISPDRSDSLPPPLEPEPLQPSTSSASPREE